MRKKPKKPVRTVRMRNKDGSFTTRRDYGDGGRQYQNSEQTKKGMKRTIYDYPPPKEK